MSVRGSSIAAVHRKIRDGLKKSEGEEEARQASPKKK